MEIICETSMRHVHLSEADVFTLFGKGVKLTENRPLSQPGQFLCNERIALVGNKGQFENVAIIGPERKESQIEISRTDSFSLGVKDVPIRLSGDIKNAPIITIQNGDKKVTAPAIIAKRHVHLDPHTATKNNFKDGEVVKIKFDGERSAILDDVVVRVDKNFSPAVHIDSDEANAVLAGVSTVIIKD